jgi:hypothetical protein
MELLGNVGYLEYRFCLFGDSVSFSARQLHGFHQMHHRLRNPFVRTRWYS